MSSAKVDLSALSGDDKQKLLKKILEKRNGATARAPEAAAAKKPDTIRESFWNFEKFPLYQQLHVQRAVGERAGISNPFFMVHDGIAADTTVVDGRELINFSTYNYLGLNGHPRVAQAAKDAIDRYGISASASRLVSGERQPHRDLEKALADLHGVEDCLAFVSGHATNVSTIGNLMGPKDLILHDRLIHNSALQGAQLSGATRQSFPHNDWRALDGILTQNRARYEKVLIIVEGLYSMDGDICPLDRMVELKQRHKALLMVDEAHSIGVLGATGRGVGEHFGIKGSDVDIWMGTLSKTLSGCGGWIAGTHALVELLKFTAPGFVYSVGMPLPVTAGALASLQVMYDEPERVAKLRANGQLFVALAKARGLDIGLSEGYAVIPVVIGRSALTAKLSNALFDRGINVGPIIYPAVEERAARLRFFLSSTHSEDQIRQTIEIIGEELDRLTAEMD